MVILQYEISILDDAILTNLSVSIKFSLDIPGAYIKYLFSTGDCVPNENVPKDDSEAIKELLEVAKKYQGRIKDKTIVEAANEVAKKYKLLK